VELRSEQLGEFENTLREVRADPKQVRAWLLAKRYEKSLPLFSSTEKALMTCLKGLDRDPKACAPTAEFRRLLDEAVAAGDLPKGEADRYLNELSLLRDPRTRPAMPKGTAGFMEKESAMKVRNMEAIAAVVRRVDAAALLKPEEK
jgi:polyhydroxyalkanoate synthesis regulator phasin